MEFMVCTGESEMSIMTGMHMSPRYACSYVNTLGASARAARPPNHAGDPRDGACQRHSPGMLSLLTEARLTGLSDLGNLWLPQTLASEPMCDLQAVRPEVTHSAQQPKLLKHQQEGSPH